MFVRLLDEGLDVWRPILATHLRGDVYRITEQPRDATETWEYEPGAEVVCEIVRLSEGSTLTVTGPA